MIEKTLGDVVLGFAMAAIAAIAAISLGFIVITFRRSPRKDASPPRPVRGTGVYNSGGPPRPPARVYDERGRRTS